MSPLGHLELELRKDRRVAIRLPVLLAKLGRTSVPHVSGRVVDLSQGGIKMFTDTAYRVGDRLSMLIEVGRRGEDIGGLVQVAWIKPARELDPLSGETYAMGIQFLEINCEGLTLLARLIEKRIKKLEHKF